MLFGRKGIEKKKKKTILGIKIQVFEPQYFLYRLNLEQKRPSHRS